MILKRAKKIGRYLTGIFACMASLGVIGESLLETHHPRLQGIANILTLVGIIGTTLSPGLIRLEKIFEEDEDKGENENESGDIDKHEEYFTQERFKKKIDSYQSKSEIAKENEKKGREINSPISRNPLE